MTQPFLLEDQVEVDGEVGHIEEIQSQYVIMRTLDERRLVIPLTWFLANVSQVWIEPGYTLSFLKREYVSLTICPLDTNRYSKTGPGTRRNRSGCARSLSTTAQRFHGYANTFSDLPVLTRSMTVATVRYWLLTVHWGRLSSLVKSVCRMLWM